MTQQQLMIIHSLLQEDIVAQQRPHSNGAIVRLDVGNASSDDDLLLGYKVTGTTREIRTWSHDNFGEDLLTILEMVQYIVGIRLMDCQQEQ